MKTLITAIVTSLMLATAAQATPFSSDPTTLKEKSYGFEESIYVQKDTQTPEVLLTYYGQRNSNGTYRTNYVNGYTKSNGTHVNGYYRS